MNSVKWIKELANESEHDSRGGRDEGDAPDERYRGELREEPRLALSSSCLARRSRATRGPRRRPSINISVKWPGLEFKESRKVESRAERLRSVFRDEERQKGKRARGQYICIALHSCAFNQPYTQKELAQEGKRLREMRRIPAYWEKREDANCVFKVN